MNHHAYAGRRITLALSALLAVASMLAVLAVSGTPASGHGDEGHHTSSARTAQSDKAAALHDAMRELWEQHVAWTRMAIVSFAVDNPDLAATEARLLKNQDDIGDAIKPYYGRAAGNQLTKLLREHITGAVTLLQAAKTDDTAKLGTAKDAWYVNGRQVADFLSRANKRNWPRSTMRSMMKTHLDQTLDEAVAQLTGDFTESVRTYDEIEQHIIEMSDALADGIVAQFPRRFR
jgi:hypothetical protein